MILNYLFDLLNGYGINYVLYLDSWCLVRCFGVLLVVIKNMGVREVIVVVGYVYRWFYEYGDDIVVLIEGVCVYVVEVYKKKRKMKGLNFDCWFVSLMIVWDFE